MALKPNSAPARQESKLSRNGDQLNLQIAIRCNRIGRADISELKEVLRLVMMKIGLRAANMPTEIEKAVLIGHIYENYSGHTLEEIKLAFDMAISGKLDVDATCYENFSCLYFSSIMNAYRDWAKQEVKEMPAEEKELPKPDKLTIDMEYCYHKQKEIWKLPINKLKILSKKVFSESVPYTGTTKR